MNIKGYIIYKNSIPKRYYHAMDTHTQIKIIVCVCLKNFLERFSKKFLLILNSYVVNDDTFERNTVLLRFKSAYSFTFGPNTPTRSVFNF